MCLCREKKTNIEACEGCCSLGSSQHRGIYSQLNAVMFEIINDPDLENAREIRLGRRIRKFGR